MEDMQNLQEPHNDRQGQEEQPKWYVVHTYSGYEKKVKANIDKTIANDKELAGQIIEVRVPEENAVEIKNGKKRSIAKKLFPGYVLVNMIMNDDTWYIVRNTRGVTGFVGPGSKAVALTEEEIIPLLGEQPESISVDFEVGDKIEVISGLWKDTVGIVRKIDYNKRTAMISVDLLSGETSVEVDFTEVKNFD